MLTPTTTTQSVAFAVPVLPGKADADRRAMASCRHGDRRSGYEASRKRLGILREAVWFQGTPGGDLAIVHLEAGDLEQAFSGMATSDDAFDRWFRAHCRDVHGIDLAAGFARPEQILDFRER